VTFGSPTTFFPKIGYNGPRTREGGTVPNDPRTPVSDLEKQLQAQFDPAHLRRFSSTATDAAKSEYVQELVLPDDKRGMMPYTKSDLVISENPLRVEWEKEVRKFLGRLSTHTSHRVTAPMIYEWATGIKIADILAADQAKEQLTEPTPGTKAQTEQGKLNVHLRAINFVLGAYFGKPYKTKIMGREVGRAYTVRAEFRVKLKKPANMTLWPEWAEGTLEP